MYIVLIIIVLMLVLLGAMIVVFKRIMDKQVMQATQHLDEMGHDYELKQKKVSKELEDARNKAQEIVITAQNDAEKQKIDIIKQAQAEGERLIQEARAKGEEMIRQAENSGHRILSEVEERINKDALRKACEIIQQSLPDELRKPAHAQWVRELIESDFSQVAKLHVPAEVGEFKVVSAFALSPEQAKAVSEKVKAALNRQIALVQEVDPALVAGISISIGSVVLDGSLKNRIQEKTRV